MALQANIWHFTWFWDGLSHGGSEGWYFISVNPDSQVQLEAMNTLNLKRAALLGDRGFLIGLRMAMFTDSTGARVTRKSQIQKLSFPGTQTSGGLQNRAREDPMSLQLTCIHAPTRRKKIQFMGLPWAGVLPGDDEYNPAFGGWSDLFNSWATDMVAKGVGWIGQTPSLPITITGYVMDAQTGQVTFTVSAPTTWPNADDFVVNINFKGQQLPFEGRQVVQPLSSTTVKTIDSFGVRPFNGVRGKLFTEDVQFYSLADTNPLSGRTGFITPQGPCRKKRGRVSIVSPGRRPRISHW